MASVLAGLDSLTKGRACLVMASGDTAAYNAGLKPGRRAVIEDYVQCMRDLIRTGRATFQGREQVVRWSASAPPTCNGKFTPMKHGGNIALVIFRHHLEHGCLS